MPGKQKDKTDQTKITKLLRLMKLLTGNVSRTIDSLAKEMGVTTRTVYRYIETIREAGFVVNKLYGNVYAMGKVVRGLSDFNKLIYFTEEEAYLTAKMIEGIDNNNPLKRDLQRKLASVYDCTSIANYIANPANAANIEALSDAIKHKKQVVLKGYASAHSDETRDRVVEPFSFTANMIDVWAYDVEKADCRVPLAERDLKREDGKWILRTTVQALEGVGRFVIGLAADVKVVEGKKLVEYVRKYDKKWVQKI